ncbi:MAG: ribonuclease E activity regulator RraA [Pseudomonadota bacterium]
MPLFTADLCDAHPDTVRVAEPVFESYGRPSHFSGRIRTVRVFEDNVLVKEALSGAGHGKVLVVDGGGSTRCARLGGNIAALAAANGWNGIVIYGCLRDVHEIDETDIGVRAIASCPRKSAKHGRGERDVPLFFAGIDFLPEEYLYADRDGLIVAEQVLDL